MAAQKAAWGPPSPSSVFESEVVVHSLAESLLAAEMALRRDKHKIYPLPHKAANCRA
jgi:hypothetical protein